jgi:hypothetical protein
MLRLAVSLPGGRVGEKNCRKKKIGKKQRLRSVGDAPKTLHLANMDGKMYARRYARHRTARQGSLAIISQTYRAVILYSTVLYCTPNSSMVRSCITTQQVFSRPGHLCIPAAARVTDSLGWVNRQYWGIILSATPHAASPSGACWCCASVRRTASQPSARRFALLQDPWPLCAPCVPLCNSNDVL